MFLILQDLLLFLFSCADSKIEFFLPHSDPRHLTLIILWLTYSLYFSLFVLAIFIDPLEVMEASEHGACSIPGCKEIGHFKTVRHLGPHRYVELPLLLEVPYVVK